jgi:hypothetical protein
LIGLRHKAGAKGRARGALGPVAGSVLLTTLLFCEMASAMMGAGTVFFASVVVAWLVLPAVVGLENVLDAGCVFMLVSLGIVVVVGAASHGAASLLT